ncbi:MAG TPA: 23S rRNA (uracil(1939)-C(5))-methyltransferase RlmD [Gammaproteobacteria bacterium]|nr:23S rRNA (uracil(1939)-C(5))-methyltransferase RlmD [Gammaproteobacteria bacterium]
MAHEPFESTIESLSHDGRGITARNQKTTFVSGALPGEKVTAKIAHQHRRYDEARVLDVITPSPDRTEPACAHYGVCGGCSMQHVKDEAEVRLKQDILLDQLKHLGKVTPTEILPPITGHPFGYRRKARLGVRYVIKKEKLLVGFREKFSNYLADIQTCKVLHPSVGERLSELATFIRSLTQYDQIPQIEVAVSDTATALVFRHMTPLPKEDIHALCEFGQKYQFHIYLQPDSPDSVHRIFPDESEQLLSYFLPDYQLEMRFHPLDFTQVNAEMNHKMIASAIQLLDLKSSDTVLDLFCGLGNFTLPIARFAKHVTGVEGSTQMVERAKENALLNQITNAAFYAANLMKPSESAPWITTSFDKILLDPPRTGAREILPFIANKSASRIVYVSCNPATLARDANDLVTIYGYTLKKTGAINMFPHTSHIEAIALFEK